MPRFWASVVTILKPTGDSPESTGSAIHCSVTVTVPSVASTVAVASLTSLIAPASFAMWPSAYRTTTRCCGNLNGWRTDRPGERRVWRATRRSPGMMTAPLNIVPFGWYKVVYRAAGRSGFSPAVFCSSAVTSHLRSRGWLGRLSRFAGGVRWGFLPVPDLLHGARTLALPSSPACGRTTFHAKER